MTFIRNLCMSLAALFAGAVAQAAAPGEELRWSLDFRAGLQHGAQTGGEVHITGEWIAAIAAVRANDYDVQLRLADPKFVGAAAERVPAPAQEDLRRRLTQSFWATCRSDGGITTMHFPRDMAPADRNLLQMIATELQLVRPSAARTSWTAQERDGGGEYVALYVTPQPGRILKRKLKYLHVDDVAQGRRNALPLAIDRAETTYALAADGAIERVDGDARLNFMLSPESDGSLTSVVEIHANHLRRGNAPGAIGSLARASVDSSAVTTQRPDPAVARAASDARLLGDRSTASLLDAAFAEKADDEDLDARLRALFRQRSEAAIEAAVRLRRDGAQPRVTRALGAAATREATSTLAALARDHAVPAKLRIDALTAVAEAKSPGMEAMRIPLGLLDDADADVRNAARLTAGTLAHAGRDTQAAAADAIDAALLARLRRAQSSAEMIEMLDALGNSSGSASLPDVEKALLDPRAPVRAAAVRALRLAPGEDIDERIAASMRTDVDVSVRADAVFAARFRRPLPQKLADALLDAARRDVSDSVRSNAVAELKQSPEASPRIAETLAYVAAHDASAGIRRQASDFVAPSSADFSQARQR